MSSSSASSSKLENLEFVKIINRSQRAIIRQLRDPSTGESYAVKEYVDRPISAIDRVQIYRENGYLRDSTSPFIVKHHGNIGEGDEFKIVLEYVDGSNIGSSGPIPEPTLSRYAHQILLGLSHLYSRRIVHGDVNPENILIDSKGRVKICGLGNSEKLPGETVVFKRWEGTSYVYRCADKLRGDSCNGYISDIWSFGMTLLHGHIGSHPIIGPYAKFSTRLMYQMYVWNEEPKLLTPEDSSDDFKNFISRCMQKESSDRSKEMELHKKPSDRSKAMELLLDLLKHPFIIKHQDGSNAHHLSDRNPQVAPSSSSSHNALNPLAGSSSNTAQNPQVAPSSSSSDTAQNPLAGSSSNTAQNPQVAPSSSSSHTAQNPLAGSSSNTAQNRQVAPSPSSSQNPLAGSSSNTGQNPQPGSSSNTGQNPQAGSSSNTV